MQKQGEDFITARSDDSKKSVPYITSYNFTDTFIRGQKYNEDDAEKFLPGLPLPAASGKPSSFWLDDPSRPIGGKIADVNGVQFGVPNIVYDYQSPHSRDGYMRQDSKVHIIETKDPDRTNEKYKIGLFSKTQFQNFKGNSLAPNAPISPQDLDAEIARVRYKLRSC